MNFSMQEKVAEIRLPNQPAPHPINACPEIIEGFNRLELEVPK